MNTLWCIHHKLNAARMGPLCGLLRCTAHAAAEDCALGDCLARSIEKGRTVRMGLGFSYGLLCRGQDN